MNKIMDNFELKHNNGKLSVIVEINSTTYEKDVTEYFEKDNPHDDWLDYRIDLKYFAEKSKLKKENA